METPLLAARAPLVALGIAIAAAAILPARAETYSGASSAEDTIVRAPVWIYFEPVPGATETPPPPAEDLRAVARYVLGGMIYGWRFSYTPSDRARRVEESFSLEPIAEISPDDPLLRIREPIAEYPRLYAWAEYPLDEARARRVRGWSSVLYPTAKGRGRGERVAGAGGIKAAYEAAALNAVRELARKRTKNKPREVRGEVLLRESPRLFADQGWFVAEVRLFANLEAIDPYAAY